MEKLNSISFRYDLFVRHISGYVGHYLENYSSVSDKTPGRLPGMVITLNVNVSADTTDKMSRTLIENNPNRSWKFSKDVRAKVSGITD